MSPEQRDKLAAEQAALVDALAGRSAPPAGFDPVRVATAAASLLAKRRRGVEKAWPGLAESLGDRFRRAFAEYARAQPTPADGSHEDGRLFARYLRHRGELSEDGRLQLLLTELRWYRPLVLSFLPRRRALVVAFLAFRRARWFPVPCSCLRRRADFSQPLSPAPK